MRLWDGRLPVRAAVSLLATFNLRPISVQCPSLDAHWLGSASRLISQGPRACGR
jgi:hypothetical protein